jgi:hypothetical protein
MIQAGAESNCRLVFVNATSKKDSGMPSRPPADSVSSAAPSPAAPQEPVDGRCRWSSAKSAFIKLCHQSLL